MPGNEDKADRFLRAAQADSGSLPWELGILGSAGRSPYGFAGALPGRDHADRRHGLSGAYGGLAADAGDLTNQLAVLHRESEQRRRELAGALESLRRMQATLVQGEKHRPLGMLVASIAHEVNNPLAFAAAGIEEVTASPASPWPCSTHTARRQAELQWRPWRHIPRRTICTI